LYRLDTAVFFFVSQTKTGQSFALASAACGHQLAKWELTPLPGG
jgi:hypothetical protein